MKFVWGYVEWGWKVYGLCAKDGRWFFGYSRAVSLVETYREKGAGN